MASLIKTFHHLPGNIVDVQSDIGRGWQLITQVDLFAGRIGVGVGQGERLYLWLVIPVHPALEVRIPQVAGPTESEATGQRP